MASLAVSTSKPASSGQNKGLMKALGRRWDVLAVFLLVVVSFPVNWLSPRSLVIEPNAGFFDDHWVYDTVFKASRGIRFGIDVASPLGPLFQWLASAPILWTGFSMGKVAGLFHTFLLWWTYLLGYFALRTLMPEQPSWKRFVLLIVLCIFWVPWDGRAILDIFLFSLFLKASYRVRDRQLSISVFGCMSAIACIIALLYSSDTGVYAIAGFVLALAGVGLESWREEYVIKAFVSAGFIFAAAFGVLTFVVNLTYGSPLNFTFWKSSLALVNVHRWNEPSPMSATSTLYMLTAFLLLTGIVVIRWSVREQRYAVIAARRGFLAGSYLLAMAMMQTGLVRSDPNHVASALVAAIFFGSIILFSFTSYIASAIAAAAVSICSLLWGLPWPTYHLSYLRYRYTVARHRISTCPEGLDQFEDVCYQAALAEQLYATRNYLQQHTGATDSVIMFPYQSMYGVAARRDIAGGVLHSFLAAGPYLSDLQIAGLQKDSAPLGLYFPDWDGREALGSAVSVPIDGVSSFTRSPAVWFWIFRHYRSDRELFSGVPLLAKDDSRADRISLETQPLYFKARAIQIKGRNSVIDLRAPLWPASGDFLRLRLRVSYPLEWKLRKPERLQLEILLVDGTRELQSFVIEPNTLSDVWIYPWKQTDLVRYFGADEAQWRTTPHPVIASLRLWITPFDWISQQPSSVTIQSADAVTVHLES